MSHCTACGSEVTEKMFFCPQCGARLIIRKVSEIPSYGEQVEQKANVSSQGIERGKLYGQWVAYAGFLKEWMGELYKQWVAYVGFSKKWMGKLYEQWTAYVGFLKTRMDRLYERWVAYASLSKKRRGRLYKQWVAYAGLPADEILPMRTSKAMPVGRESDRRSFPLLHVLLGICIGSVGTALIFLLVEYL